MAFRHKTMILALAVTLALGFAGDSFARIGGGFSFGSRGARTFSAPSATPQAPQGAAPIERSMTSPKKIFSDAPRPMLRAAFFLAVWAGVYSAEHAAHGSGFGPGLGQGSVRTPGGFAGFGGGAGRAQFATKLEVTPADFSVFEQRLAAIQTAFGEEDFDRLLASYFAEELAANAKNGLVNRVSDVKFLRGDLSEAWREQQGEYATVAMRFSLVDIMSDRVSGRIVSGDPAVPQQATEVWTFARRLGAPRRPEIISDTTSLTSGESQARCWRPGCRNVLAPSTRCRQAWFAGGVTFV